MYSEPVNRYEAEFSPFWLQDRDLGYGVVRYLGHEETRFWKELIEKYLKPIEMDANDKKKVCVCVCVCV